MKYTEIKEIMSRAAKDAGIEKYEIFCSSEESISTETFRREISKFSSGTSGGVSFRCIVDGRMGYASGNLLDREELVSLVKRAADNARVIENDDEVFIFEGSEKYGKSRAPSPVPADAATLKKISLELQNKVYSMGEDVSDGTESGAMSFLYEVYIYNSNGLELSNKVGMRGCYTYAVVCRNGESEGDFEFSEGISGKDVDALPEKSYFGALSKLGATEVKSGKYDVIIDGKQMRNLLAVFSPIFSAKNALLGLSLLEGKEGEMIASKCVSITDDPLREGCPLQTPFDGEGVATYKKTVVDKGVLKTLLYDLTTAKKCGKQTTANGQRGGFASQVSISPYNFSICEGEYSEEELLERLGEGIYITELKGLHAGADASTGDFSIESEGFAVHGGKKAEPVRSFTVAGNFFELLMNIDSLSDKVKWAIPTDFCVFGSPDALIRDISVAGK